ncbi:hypothetical protein D9M71_679700 [compost metagenome]
MRGRCGSWLAGEHRQSRCHPARRSRLQQFLKFLGPFEGRGLQCIITFLHAVAVHGIGEDASLGALAWVPAGVGVGRAVFKRLVHIAPVRTTLLIEREAKQKLRRSQEILEHPIVMALHAAWSLAICLEQHVVQLLLQRAKQADITVLVGVVDEQAALPQQRFQL